MDAPNIGFNITNQSFTPGKPAKGIHYVAGETEMGPHADPSELITSWPHFQRVFGSYMATSDFPLLCQRALSRGASLRVSRVGHYSDPTDKTTLTALKPEINNLVIITFDADLVASNAINATINGQSITQVTYATSSDATMTAVAAELAGLDNISYAAVIPPDSGNIREIVALITDNLDTHDITVAVTAGASQASVSVDSPTSILSDTGVDALTITSKYAGAIYNGLSVTLSAPSNGQSGTHFNMTVELEGKDLTERYQNLKWPTTTAEYNTYLNDVKKSSKLITIVVPANSVKPKLGKYYFKGGSDGGAVLTTDYNGDSAAGTGFYAFDGYDDGYDICVPEKSDSAIHIAGSAYAENRKDICYLAHLSNANISVADYIADRNATNIDSYLTKFYGGGVIITDPLTGEVKEISEMGDVLGAISFSDKTAAEWFSPAGITRGKFLNCLGVVRNFGTAAKYAEMNQLCNAGINMSVQADNLVYLNSDFTATLSNSKLSFGNIVKLVLFLQRSLRPTLKRYQQNPNDFPQWRALYYEGHPIVKALATGESRGLYNYAWEGDQFVTKIEDIVINRKDDVDLGKYKIRLFLKTISPMVDLTMDMVITKTDTTFEIA